MRALSCPKCGAPVEIDESSGAASFRCSFCGSTLAPTRSLSAAGVPVVIDLRLARRVGASAARWVALIFALTLGFTGWIVWTSVRAATAGIGAVPSNVTRAVSTTAERDRPRTLTELGRATGGGGWIALEAAPPVGGFAALDPVAALPWALTVAQAWAQDATLVRIDVVRLRPDGTVNVADDAEAEVMYRFESSARIADYRRRAELSTRVESEHELFVKLAGGRITALVVRGEPDDSELPPYPRVLSTTELARRLAGDERFRRPFLQGYLIRLEREGWVWYLSPLARGESLPRVRATDARVWPYRG